MNRPAAQQVDGRVDGRAPEVGRRRRSGLDVSTAGQDAQEDGLQDVLGVGRVPGDAQGRAEYRLVVALVQLGKPNRRSRGSHGDRLLVGNLQAGCGHVARLTSLDAPGGRLLHGVREKRSWLAHLAVGIPPAPRRLQEAFMSTDRAPSPDRRTFLRNAGLGVTAVGALFGAERRGSELGQPPTIGRREALAARHDVLAAAPSLQDLRPRPPNEETVGAAEEVRRDHHARSAEVDEGLLPGRLPPRPLVGRLRRPGRPAQYTRRRSSATASR